MSFFDYSPYTKDDFEILCIPGFIPSMRSNIMKHNSINVFQLIFQKDHQLKMQQRDARRKRKQIMSIIAHQLLHEQD